ncbi:MAG: AI-2E family transporter [Clostridium sp.]
MSNLKKINVSWILTIVVSYLIILAINNYTYFESIVFKFIKILSPFFIGLLIAYILYPAVKFLEKQFKLKRFISLLIIYGIVIILSTTLFIWIMPILVNSLLNLVSELPDLSVNLENWIRNFKLDVDTDTAQTIIDKLVTIIPKVNNAMVWLINSILNTTISLTTFAVNFIFSIIISIYILSNKDNFRAYCKKVLYIILKKKKATLVVDVIMTFHHNIGTYIVAKSIDSFLVGVVSGIGLYVLGSKYALLFGVLCGVTNMIPFFGPFIGMVPVFVINLFYNPSVSITTLIYLVILQQIEGNIIEPKFVGSKLGLNPLLTLLAVTLGGAFFGIIGMVLSVPVMGVIKIYLDKLIANYSFRRDLD